MLGHLNKIASILHIPAAVFTQSVFERIVRLLAESGFDLNEQDSKGWAALHYSIKYGLTDLTKTLVQLGADLSIRTRVSSWISVKLPVLYHCLYWLDLESAEIIISCNPDSVNERVKNCADFTYYPASVADELKNCLMKIEDIFPVTFLLFVFVIKAYADPGFSSQKVNKLLCQAAGFADIFQRHESCPTPDAVVDFYRKSQTSILDNGHCKGRFFLQTVKALFSDV